MREMAAWYILRGIKISWLQWPTATRRNRVGEALKAVWQMWPAG